MEKRISDWGCEGEWDIGEITEFAGYDERCQQCLAGQEHCWNIHYRLVNLARRKRK